MPAVRGAIKKSVARLGRVKDSQTAIACRVFVTRRKETTLKTATTYASPFGQAEAQDKATNERREAG